jgi:hypothetical protein
MGAYNERDTYMLGAMSIWLCLLARTSADCKDDTNIVPYGDVHGTFSSVHYSPSALDLSSASCSPVPKRVMDC